MTNDDKTGLFSSDVCSVKTGYYILLNYNLRDILFYFIQKTFISVFINIKDIIFRVLDKIRIYKTFFEGKRFLSVKFYHPLHLPGWKFITTIL